MRIGGFGGELTKKTSDEVFSAILYPIQVRTNLVRPAVEQSLAHLMSDYQVDRP